MSNELEPQKKKWWLDSQTIHGTLLTCVPILAMILGAFGVEAHDEEINAFVQGIMGIVGMYGAFMAIEGRFKTKGEKLSVKKESPSEEQ